MLIRNLEKNDIQYAQEFITPYEFSCVMLGFLIRKADSSVFLVLNNSTLKNVSDIYGVFSYDGTMHYCFPFFSENRLKFCEFESLFTEFLKNQKKKLKCLNGLSESTHFFLDILEKVNISPYQINRYNLLTLKDKPLPPPEALQNDDEIKRCVQNDFDYLYPLQKEYLIAEVVPKGKELSDLECSVILKGVLKNQICVAVVSDGTFVAKANTNAIGLNYVQIGGVYTDPLYRRNYYAWHLIYFLSKLLTEKNKKVCLFVKDKNIQALELYKKTGFAASGKFEICYFN